MKTLIARALLWAITIGSSSVAGAAERFADWRTGDLIFHESTSAQAAAIRVATGSRYTHMGIVRQTDAGLYVVEAAQTVSQTPLRDFLARGVGRDYSVYRVAALTPEAADSAIVASLTYAGRPYDIFFRLDPDRIYCSELPFYAFQKIGIELGKIERLGDLSIDTPEGRAIFLSRWQDHPDCDGIDRDGCWNLIQAQEIVTPVSIAEDPQLKRVYSTFRE